MKYLKIQYNTNNLITVEDGRIVNFNTKTILEEIKKILTRFVPLRI